MDSLLTASNSKRSPITPPKRNPITQADVEVPAFKASRKAPAEADRTPEKRREPASGESTARKSLFAPPNRNPITQVEIQVPSFKSSKKAPAEIQPSPERKVGIGMSQFSEQGRRSFSLAYDEPEPVTFTKKMLCPEPYNLVVSTACKRAEFTPTPRNPIIQEETLLTPPKIRNKMTESSIFKTEPRRNNKIQTVKLGA